MTRRHLTLLLFFFVVFWAGFQFALIPGGRDVFSPEYWRQLHSVGQVMRLIRADHVDGEAIRFRDLSEPAIREMIRSVDEFSGFMSNREFEAFEIQARQEYVGIGVEIAQRDSEVEITTVFPSSPAEEADLRAGDRFLSVDGRDASNLSLTEIVALVRGVPETEVKLQVRRLGATPLRQQQFAGPLKLPVSGMPRCATMGLVTCGYRILESARRQSCAQPWKD